MAEINSTISAVANYRIIGYAEPFYSTSAISGYTDVISGEEDGVIVQRAFRRSSGGQSWSLWTDFTLADTTPLTSIVLDPAVPLYIEFRYTAVPDGSDPVMPDGTVLSPEITVEEVDLQLTTVTVDPYLNYIPVTRCSDEVGVIPVLIQDSFKFNPYAVNKSVLLYKELSKMVNLTFGHEVNYFRVVPQLRSKDVVFMEWSLLQATPPKCLKILVPNNEFPDAKPTYNQFGIDFEVPFEVHIDRGYWEGIYGKNTMPQERDYMYFPLLNRMYTVQSTNPFRYFMQQVMYYKVMLVKYQDRADILKDPGTEQLINDATMTPDEMFGADFANEVDRYTKPQQYVTITADQDPTRASVHRLLPITAYNLYNNWTLVADNFYDLTDLFGKNGAVAAVTYRAQGKLGATDSRGFMCWFSPQAGTTKRFLHGSNALGAGYDIDMNFSESLGGSSVVLTIAGSAYTFVLTGVALVRDSWYGLVVNFSNEFAQAGVDLWMMQPDNSALDHLCHKTGAIVTAATDSGEPLSITATTMSMTNIRIFDRMVEEEKQAFVLSQHIVTDSEKVILIDACRPLLRIPKIANPK